MGKKERRLEQLRALPCRCVKYLDWADLSRVVVKYECSRCEQIRELEDRDG